MKEIQVSVFCAAYNHEKYIKKCLDGFVMQKTDFAFEVIINDDLSTDGTAAVIRDYAQAYPDIIKPIFQTENQYGKGVCIDRDIIYPKAKGKYFAFCEGDDYWTDDNKLQLQYDFLEAHADTAVCAHGALLVNLYTGKNRLQGPRGRSRYFSADEVILGGGGFVATSSLFMRREAYESVPQCLLKYRFGDYQLQICSSIYGKFYYMAQKMSVYNYGTAGSFSRRIKCDGATIDHQLKLIEMLQALDDCYQKKYGDAIESTVKYERLSLLIMQKKYKEAKAKEYKKAFKKVPFMARLKINMTVYCPRLLRLIMRIKKGKGGE